MITIPTDLAPVDFGVESMQRQLFRYAQDLQELMEQQRQLQQNYQMVLKSMGHEVPENDILSSTLIEASKIHVVTDPLGAITYASNGAVEAFGRPLHLLAGNPIGKLLAPNQPDGFHAVVEKFALSTGTGGIEQRKFELSCSTPGAVSGHFDVLAMQVVKETGRNEIYWLFQPAVQSSDIAIQSSFINASDTDIGFFVTDPAGTICSINAALTKLTGFYNDEVLGQNPRRLGSGRHENAFFQDFFLALLDAGCWNGQILNRKKSGQIFLTWQSVKMVEDAHGAITSYIAAVADLSLRVRDSDGNLTSLAAYQDPLTGLANRRTMEHYFNQALAEARADGTTLWSLFLNVDGFSRIGDELGHAIGAQARQEIGARLKSIERHQLSVSDLGDGKFVVLLQGQLSESDVAEIASTTVELLSAPMQVGPHCVWVKAFIGCAAYPRDGIDRESLLSHADTAMCAAKKFLTPYFFYESDDIHTSAPTL